MTSASFLFLSTLLIPYGLGVNIHFTGEPKDLDLIADCGFRFIRMDLVWSSIEKEKGIYKFEETGYDALTEGCWKRGIKILYILDYSNKLYESDRSVQTEEGRKAFANFAEAAVKRYAGKGIIWEVWNEPNISQFWQPQPSVDDYCKLVEATSQAIKKADPSCILVAPATSGIPFEWLEECFKRGLLNWIDALSVHPYRHSNPETVIKDYARLRELMKKYSPDEKSILSGEWGYSLINWDNKRLTEETQAQYLVRMFLTNLYQGIPVSIWYDWKDDGLDPNEREHHFGTMTNDLKPKMAYISAKTLSDTLAGYKVIERINIGSEDDYILKLKSDDKSALVLWTTGEQHVIELPEKINTGTLIDMLGREKVKIEKENKVKISQSPCYIIINDQ